MALSGKRVVLAEDDRFLRRACETALRQRGLTVLVAIDGEEALRLVQSGPPDLVVLDLLMPKMGGIEVLQALKADPATRAIPILVLSNSSREESMRQAMSLGAVGYLVKAHVSLQELADRIAKLLEG